MYFRLISIILSAYFTTMELSVVIPICNEEESIAELLRKLSLALRGLKGEFELIFVDDGSTDSTLAELKKLQKKSANIHIISFRRNFGKSYALTTGFQKAKGNYIVTLDADLQDDPSNIKTLYEEIKKRDADMINGWRKNRKDSEIKLISSKAFNRLVSFLFDITINDLNSGLKIYKSEVAKELNLYGGMHRFIPLLVSEMGYEVKEKEVIHLPRKYGFSKYKPTKILTDIPDLITIYFLTKYTRRPLHFFGKIGALSFLGGTGILTYLSTLWFLGESIGRRPLLLLGILLIILGIQILVTGLLADLIVHASSNKTDHPPIKYASD